MSIPGFISRRLGFLVTSFIAGLALIGCSPAQHDAVVASIGNDKITLGQYENLYAKNNAGRDSGTKSTQQERETFLDLLVNYRLKLLDAYREGVDRKPDILSELDQYRGSLCSSFLTDRDVLTPGLTKLYDQRKEELRAKHIMIALKPGAPAADSAKAYQKAAMILDLLKKGASFDSLALTNSEDPSVKNNKGDLYYFTAGSMVPPFEDAAYSMRVGEVSAAAVRTQYGLHIIKLTDRKPSEGEMRCSHIMIQFTGPNPSPADTLAAYTKILALKDSLDKGTDFAELAKRNSTDPGSAAKGGDLGWFARRRWILPFDEVAFSLKLNQVSGVVRTAYGYHLIKCTERRPMKSFDESRDELKQLYQKTRFQEDYAAYLSALKQRLHFTAVDSIITRFIASCDTTKSTRDSGWAAGLTPDLGRRTIYVVNSQPVSVDSVVAIVSSRPDLYNSPARAPQLRATLDKLAENLVFGMRAGSLEQEDPKFASIVRDYKEGLLLYQVEQDRVWNRIAPSDSLLHAYYAAEHARFTFPDRVNVTEIHAATQDAARTMYRQLQAGTTMERLVAQDSARMSAPTQHVIAFTAKGTKIPPTARAELALVAQEAGKDTLLRLQIITHPDTATARANQMRLADLRAGEIMSYLSGKLGVSPSRIVRLNRPLPPDSTRPHRLSPGSSVVDVVVIGRVPLVRGRLTTSLLPAKSDERSKAADTLSVGGYASPFTIQGTWVIVRLDGREPSREKTYDEATPEVASAFQESESQRLERTWLDGLKKQYPVVEHKELLKEAFAQPER